MFAVILSSLSPLFGRSEPWLSGGRRMLAVMAATAAIATAACDDPFAPRASTPVRTDSFVVYAVSKTPVNVPAAFNIVLFTPLRLEPTYGFDVAFDINDAGKAVLIPVRLVGGAITAGRRVGLQRITGAYDEVTQAPTSGYQYDSALVLDVADAAIVEVQTDACQFTTSRNIYAKLQIIVIDPIARTMGFRITYDPNCGFRSFLPGVPTN